MFSVIACTYNDEGFPDRVAFGKVTYPSTVSITANMV